MQSWTGGPRAAWRVEKGQSLHYADLVGMFGPPERLAGTADAFTAWWCVGAWARSAAAKVVEGTVTEFDGRAASPEACCELVRQRTEAYAQATDAVKVESAAARACYDHAAAAVAAEMRKQAAALARDGLTLTTWRLASFDSAGTCVAPLRNPLGSYTVRAAVDCNYVLQDGQASSKRRFVAVTVTPKPEGPQTADFALFAPRD